MTFVDALADAFTVPNYPDDSPNLAINSSWPLVTVVSVSAVALIPHDHAHVAAREASCHASTNSACPPRLARRLINLADERFDERFMASGAVPAAFQKRHP